MKTTYCMNQIFCGCLILFFQNSYTSLLDINIAVILNLLSLNKAFLLLFILSSSTRSQSMTDGVDRKLWDLWVFLYPYFPQDAELCLHETLVRFAERWRMIYGTCTCTVQYVRVRYCEYYRSFAAPQQQQQQNPSHQKLKRSNILTEYAKKRPGA